MKISAVWERIRSDRNPVRFIVSRLLKRTGLCRLIKIRRDGYVLRFFPTSLSAALWADTGERASDEDLLCMILRPGDTFIDVGANIGSLTVKAASLVGPTGRVHSFEANPRTCEYLDANVRLNHMETIVSVHRYALGEADGEIRFLAERSDDMDHVSDKGSLHLPVHKMENVLGDLGGIALLKVDVEGFEIPVLRGAGRLLDVTHVIYVESYEPQLRRYGYCTMDLVHLLCEHGFQVFLRSEGAWERIPEYYVSKRCENLLAISGHAPLWVNRLVR